MLPKMGKTGSSMDNQRGYGLYLYHDGTGGKERPVVVFDGIDGNFLAF